MQMRAFAAMLPDDTAIRDLASHVESLPGSAPESTVTGDVKRGKSLYSNCTACHGANGQGIWALNAPRLAQISDWYLARQLKNFRAGIRGAHRQDYYGRQWVKVHGGWRFWRSGNSFSIMRKWSR